MELLLRDLPRLLLPIARHKDDLGEPAECRCCAFLVHGQARSCYPGGVPDTPRLAVAGWRSILLRNLSGCLLLCLFHLRRRGQGSSQPRGGEGPEVALRRNAKPQQQGPLTVTNRTPSCSGERM